MLYIHTFSVFIILPPPLSTLFPYTTLFRSFNEAMCAHQTDAVIFSEAFIQTRADGHGVSTVHYRETTIEPLQSLFEQTYAYIVLWFRADMFCQMNMLTIDRKSVV